MRPGNVRLQIHAGKNVGVIPNRTHSIAPRVLGCETIVAAESSAVLSVRSAQRPGVKGLAAAVGQLTRAEHWISPVSHIGVAVQATYVRPTDLPNQGEATRPHDLIEEMGEGCLQLGDFFSAVSVRVLAGYDAQYRYGGIKRCECAVQHVSGVDLDWRIRPVANLTSPGGTGRQCRRETQAIELDVLGILNEVAGIAGDESRGQARL